MHKKFYSDICSTSCNQLIARTCLALDVAYTGNVTVQVNASAVFYSEGKQRA